jgi:CRP-like cAMP-binding protein
MNHSRPTSATVAQRGDPKDNRLLATLTGADWERWRRQLEWVDLRPGQSLYEPGRSPRHAYFPTSAVASLLCTDASGTSTEIAVVGNEGVVGISLFLGGNSTTSGGSVLIAGQGFRIGAQAIQDEFGRSDAVRRVLLRFIQALTTQIAQTAICNRHHTIEQQLCGFLLHSLDRLRGDEVVVTQEHIAGMLGVRRESVTAAAGHLQEAGLIHYGRGHIAVLDPARLERRSCECHAVVKKEYDRLLPQEPLARPADPGRRTWPAWKEAAQGRRTPQQEFESAPRRDDSADRRRCRTENQPRACS